MEKVHGKKFQVKSENQSCPAFTTQDQFSFHNQLVNSYCFWRKGFTWYVNDHSLMRVLT